MLPPPGSMAAAFQSVRRLKSLLRSLRLSVRLRGREDGQHRPRRRTAGGTPTRRDFNRLPINARKTLTRTLSWRDAVPPNLPLLGAPAAGALFGRQQPGELVVVAHRGGGRLVG